MWVLMNGKYNRVWLDEEVRSTAQLLLEREQQFDTREEFEKEVHRLFFLEDNVPEEFVAKVETIKTQPTVETPPLEVYDIEN